jgi:hypothetical protein
MTEMTIPVGGINDIALPSPSRYHRIDGSVCNYADWQAGGALLHGRPAIVTATQYHWFSGPPVLDSTYALAVPLPR